MKKFLMALAVLALVSAPAFAGPNAGGTLVVHDTGLAYTSDASSYPSDAPPCDQMDNRIDGTSPIVWKVYAAFPDGSSPRLKALVMGATFPGDVIVLAGGLPDPVNDFEIAQNGWPTTSGGGVGISFGAVQTTQVIECYWLGGYNYGSPAMWSLAPHPTQAMVFVDDSVPPVEDAIVALSSIGFNMDGVTNCPSVPQEGACCFADGSCQLLLPDACIAAGGTVYGGPCDPNPCPPPPPEGACCLADGTCLVLNEVQCQAVGGILFFPDVPCDPNPCPVPVEETSWGSIKAHYR